MVWGDVSFDVHGQNTVENNRLIPCQYPPVDVASRLRVHPRATRFVCSVPPAPFPPGGRQPLLPPTLSFPLTVKLSEEALPAQENFPPQRIHGMSPWHAAVAETKETKIMN